MSISLAATGSTTVVLPNPMFGDRIQIITGVEYRPMADGRFYTKAKYPSIRYVWNFNYVTCSSPVLSSIANIVTFFANSRGKELTVSPMWGGTFKGYFDQDELEIVLSNKVAIFTLNILRRLSDVGDVR